MTRRRLRLVCSSDEEEEEDNNALQQANGVQSQVPTVTHQQATSSSTPPVHITISNVPEPVTISDDEFIDVRDNLTPPSPAPPSHRPPSPPNQAPASTGGDTGSPIGEFLCRLGLRLRREWLESCIGGLESSIPRFSSLDLAAKAKLCFEQFLFADMNFCGGGVLPQNVASMHLVELPGPFVLQVDEVVNISCPLRGRYQDAPCGLKRCLKLSMTDGAQRVFGMEYRPIKDLKVLASAGFKVVISNVQVCHGLLMLVPEVLEVLGGMVEELEDVRKRLIDEVNKPPRGRRTRNGVVPSLATRATHAAWAVNSSNTDTHGYSSLSENAIPPQTFEQGTPVTASRTDLHWTTMDGPSFASSVGNAVPALHNVVSRVDHMHINTMQTGGGRAVSDSRSNSEPDRQGVDIVRHNITSRRTTQAYSVHCDSENVMFNEGSNVVSHVEEMLLDPVPTTNDTSITSRQTNAPENVDGADMAGDVEISITLPRDMEVPFTYLASLSAKWAAVRVTAPSVQGTVKCFLTGVKSFQYKRRATYELLCYVDDGSLISEILIDHKIVEDQIGHSPEEVSAALSSSDARKVSGIKETLKKFQIFLLNFEGTMVVEMNATSSYPIARELCQGCAASVAHLLLRRLRNSYPHQNPPAAPSDPIAISP